MPNYLLAGTIDTAGTTESAENLISHWPFTDGSGTTIGDTENSNPLTVTGTAYDWLDGSHQASRENQPNLRLNNSADNAYCTRTDADLVGVPAKNDGSGPSSFTVSIWFRIPETLVLTEKYYLINKMGQKGTGNYGGWSLTAQNDTERYPTFEVRSGNTTATTITSNTTLFSFRWYHLIAQYKYVANGTSEMKLWLDGTQVASTTTAVGPVQNNPQPLEVGRYKDTTTAIEYYTRVQVNNVHIYDFYLSSSQISELYNTGNPTLATPIVNPGTGISTDVHSSILGLSQFQGSKIFVYWSAIEPTQNSYSYTAIDEHINHLASNGKKAQLVVLTEGEFVVPTYITNTVNAVGNSNWKIPVYWDSAVMARLIALFNAMATQYNGNATIESVGTWRTNLLISDADKTAKSYTAAAYITQLESFISSCKPNWTNKPLLLGADYIPDASEAQISSFVSNVVTNGGGFCAPYLIPPTGFGEGTPVFKAAKATAATLGADITAKELGGEHGEFTPVELVEYGVNQLGLDYFNWTDAPTKNTPRYRFTDAVVPAVYTTPAGTVEIKWQPGHYIIPWHDNRASDLISYGWLDDPLIKGAQVRYYWNELEPIENSYDFSKIDTDIATLQSYGKKLWIMIQHQGFGTPRVPSWFPSQYVYARADGGDLAAIWETYVSDRYIELVQALAAQYNDNQVVIGINTAETALGIPKSSLSNYTEQGYADEWVRIAQTVKPSLTKTNYVQFANWLDSGNDTLHTNMIQAISNAGCGMGGPDTRPSDETDFQKIDKTFGNAHVHAYAVQATNFNTDTAQEMLDYGVDVLHCHYMFWIQRTDVNILSTIQNSNGRINAIIPTNLAS